jgi:hypothetical protein
MTNILIETDATVGATMAIAAEVTGRIHGPTQAGRLGTELAIATGYDPKGARATAQAIVDALRASGHEAWIS